MKTTIILSSLMILASFFVMLPLTYAGLVNHPNIVAAWELDDDSCCKPATGAVVRDVTGNGHDGEVIGKVRWRRDRLGRPIGSVLEFFEDVDGDPKTYLWGHVVVKNHKDLRLVDFTVSAWIQASDQVASCTNHGWKGVNQDGKDTDINRSFAQLIAGKTQNGSRSNYMMWIHGGGDLGEFATLEGHFACGFTVNLPKWGAVFTNDKTKNIADGKWHHVACTYKAPFLSAYVDGELELKVENKAVEGVVRKPSTTGHFMIGAQRVGGHTEINKVKCGIDGFVDEVAVFNAALTEAEINALRVEGLAVDSRGKLAATWGEIKSRN